MRLQLHCHEHAVRVFDVICERLARGKTSSRIQLTRRLKLRHRAGLQTQSPIPASFRFTHDVIENGARHTFAQMFRDCAHRLDLSVLRIDLLQCTAAKQFAILPHAPERHIRAAQTFHRQSMHTLRRSNRPHIREMLLKQRNNLLPGQVVDANFHRANKIQSATLSILSQIVPMPVCLGHRACDLYIWRADSLSPLRTFLATLLTILL